MQTELVCYRDILFESIIELVIGLANESCRSDLLADLLDLSVGSAD